MRRTLFLVLLAAACSDDKPAPKPVAERPPPDAAPPVIIDAAPAAIVDATTFGTIGTGHVSGTGQAPTASAGRLANVYGRGFSVEVADPTVERELAAIKRCYAEGLYSKPKLAGTVTVRVELTATGAVSSATATGVDKAVAKCMAGVIEALTFPAPKAGAPATITVPIELSPKRS